MRIEVRDRGVKATQALRNYVGLRLMSVLDHFVRHVDGVTVSVADAHPCEGGIDTRCRMLALLDSSEQVQVEETDDGLYAAIDRAAERLAHAVAFKLATAGDDGGGTPRTALGRFGSELRSAILRIEDVSGRREIRPDLESAVQRAGYRMQQS